MTIIETTGLTKRYRRIRAVDDISFSVEQGQVFGFLGPNGSGKTTTIGMLLGIVTPTRGSVRLFGGSGRAGLLAARRRTGATLETPNFYPYLTGRDNLRIVANVKRASASEIDRVLEMVALSPRAKDRFEAYSLGMKQRLAIAATLLGDPELLILDEPANGLDPAGMREIREIIVALGAAGKTIFVSSHLLHEVERMCTHVAIIRRGKIMRQASVQDIVTAGGVATLRAEDMGALERAVATYNGARAIELRGADLVVSLVTPDLAALNRYLASRGVYLSHLALRQQSLEDVFLELTGSPDAQPAEMA